MSYLPAVRSLIYLPAPAAICPKLKVLTMIALVTKVAAKLLVVIVNVPSFVTWLALGRRVTTTALNQKVT